MAHRPLSPPQNLSTVESTVDRHPQKSNMRTLTLTLSHLPSTTCRTTTPRSGSATTHRTPSSGPPRMTHWFPSPTACHWAPRDQRLARLVVSRMMRRVGKVMLSEAASSPTDIEASPLLLVGWPDSRIRHASFAASRPCSRAGCPIVVSPRNPAMGWSSTPMIEMSSGMLTPA